jgi:hypothetical protein
MDSGHKHDQDGRSKLIVVAGGREFNDYPLLKRELDRILPTFGEDITIVSGTARGADTLGERYAEENDLKVRAYPPDWDAYGRRAGILRNLQMAEEADGLVAFWDGKSKGTAHMIRISKEAEAVVHVVRY